MSKKVGTTWDRKGDLVDVWEDEEGNRWTKLNFDTERYDIEEWHREEAAVGEL